MGRPQYPPELVESVCRALELHAPARIADMGAGTGILARGFAEAGFSVVAVEPNRDMATVARAFLARHSGCTVVEGRAEATGLEAQGLDAIVVGQAFHWFDAPAAAREWKRILVPPGRVALIWNRRVREGTPFLDAYENFLREWGTDYLAVAQTYEAPEGMARLFGRPPIPTLLANAQILDEEGLMARLVSTSYLPGPEHELHEPMRAAARHLFEVHARQGGVELRYQTAIYAGFLTGSSKDPARG